MNQSIATVLIEKDECMNEGEPIVNRIIEGKLVVCRWSELSENEKRAAYNAMFNC